MARYTAAKCRLCRREGVKLFLKGIRCDTVKCGLTKKEAPPGVRARFRRRPSAYGTMLREVQKVKRYYGLLQRQFRKTFNKASRMRGNTGEELLILLEQRLDNVITLMGFATSRPHARQLITHGHITVDGRRVTKPSYVVSPGNAISVGPKEATINAIKERMKAAGDRELPNWLELKKDFSEGKILNVPVRADVSLPVQEHLIVEFCSK